jgi:hypothetical protein
MKNWLTSEVLFAVFSFPLAAKAPAVAVHERRPHASQVKHGSGQGLAGIRLANSAREARHEKPRALFEAGRVTWER